MSDTVGVTLPGGRGVDWLLAPYLDPAVKSQERAFLHGLARRLGLKTTALKQKILKSSYLLELLCKHESELRDSYSSIERDMNLTSMCLYSGPARPLSSSNRLYFQGMYGSWQVDAQIGMFGRFAWLGTGDADLRTIGRRQKCFDHYGDLLSRVSTLTLPHHGSEGNFHSELLDRVQPSFLVAAADQVGKWRHPGSNVVQAVASFGKFVSTVTSAEMSRVEERVAF